MRWRTREMMRASVDELLEERDAALEVLRSEQPQSRGSDGSKVASPPLPQQPEVLTN